jgi:hypothetical protein
MKSHLLGAVAGLFVLAGSSVSATMINYDINNLAGNTWEYTYTVSNDTLGVDIKEFTIFFEVGLFENLVASSTPLLWDPLTIQPDPGLPDDGFYDALALGPGIAPSDSLGGFSVQFDFLGAGTPGSQFFEVIDPSTFNTLDSGFTQVIPLPAAIWLFASGLIGVFGLSVARYRKSP